MSYVLHYDFTLGGFTMNAIVGGAEHVTCIDSSKSVKYACEENMMLNG